MSKATLKVAILVISTTASQHPSADSSGGVLANVFKEDGQWEVIETKIVGDVVLDIQRSILEWSDREGSVNLVVTTGGTGFATSDQTPEVGRISSFVDRRGTAIYNE
ncbi:hypothetical protein B7494_g4117 [Chlorociboria aeruginascens]|nr:hypothetical protein B7494_g4117 [Chlorociboria aeruginascens]